MPTLLASPCPSGPVVVSTPLRPAILRMARATAAELPEPSGSPPAAPTVRPSLVVFADRLHPGQVQERVQQHRGVPGRKDEAVAVGPDWILRVEAQELLPQAVGHRRQGHRAPGCPELAAWTASIDRVRIVLMHVASRSLLGLHDDGFLFSPRTSSGALTSTQTPLRFHQPVSLTERRCVVQCAVSLAHTRFPSPHCE